MLKNTERQRLHEYWQPPDEQEQFQVSLSANDIRHCQKVGADQPFPETHDGRVRVPVAGYCGVEDGVETRQGQRPENTKV